MKISPKTWIFVGLAALALWPRRGDAAPDDSAPSGPSGAVDEDLMNVSYLGNPNLIRGIRNNNPGNIEIRPNPWKGKVPKSQNTDGRFEQFYTFPYGVRAMIKLLSNYINRGDNTIYKIISTWAPTTENPTQSYIQAISDKTRIGAHEVLQANYATLQKIVPAMAEHETGYTNGWIDRDMFNLAWTLL